MLIVEGLNYHATGFSLKDIFFFVKDGECHIIMGRSGSGKTTLLECLLGLKKISSGKIFLDDKDITYYPTHKRKIAYLPQDLALFPHLNVEDNIFYGAKLAENIDNAFISKLIAMMEIKGILTKKVSQISGGEKKRVAFARALAMRPSIIMLDEPLANLDRAIAEEIQYFIKRLQKELNLTILYVTHDFDEAFF